VTLPALTLNAWLRYGVVTRILETLDDVRSVLEVGAGQGAVGVRLAMRYDYVGIEPDPISCRRLRERLDRAGRGEAVCGEVASLDGRASFDLICAFEVLEHIEDDRAALVEWLDYLRPGGWLLVSVPGRPAHFGVADELAGHYRRYAPRDLRRLLAEAGLGVPSVKTYGFPAGYVLEAGRNFLAKRSRRSGSLGELTGASGRWLQPSDRIGWATRAATAPFRVLQRPFENTERGTGLVALGRRPG
jgi:SAM-dependent methyltransferase